MQVKLITDIPSYRATSFPGARIIEWSGTDRRQITSEEFLILVGEWVRKLASAGTEKGMRIATYSIGTRIDVLAVEFAALHLGAVVCPLHASSAPADMDNMLDNLKPQFVIAPDAQHEQTLRKSVSHPIEHMIVLDAMPDVQHEIDIEIPQSRDAALVISTSGTSGDAKGVVLSHHNIISVALATAAVIPLRRRHVVISFLPVSHIMERIAIYTSLLQGVDVHLAESARHGYAILRTVHPHYITSVPRILERIFSRFQQSSEDVGFFRRQIYNWALQQGKDGSKLSRLIARLIVMGKLRRLFGMRIKGIIVGGAAMDPTIARWFATAGIAIRQGYGLSEVSGVATFNRFAPGGSRIESVGLPIPGVEIRIEKPNDKGEGEVFLAGPGLMLGYLRNAQIEQRATGDTWFATGDMGYIDRQGFLYITGRIKDNFKNASGQFVAPSRIERLLRAELSIDTALVIGLAKPYTAALIRPDFDYAAKWATDSGIHWTAPEYMIYNPDLVAYYQAVIARVNSQLSPHEQITKFALVHEPWTVEAGLLTPTLKLRRDALSKKYNKVIRDVYS